MSELICPYCGEKIKDIDVLTDLDIWAGKRTPVKCPKCGKEFWATERKTITYETSKKE